MAVPCLLDHSTSHVNLHPKLQLMHSQVVYERAVAAFPVTHYLWAQYAGYLEAHLKIGSGAFHTGHAALRL